ncbi:MAG: SufD family Fe-S cluster assembly protein [Clostridia bacterium]|nr:SufD family Fe-S cluster assembly protein [Clostridia bacterium]
MEKYILNPTPIRTSVNYNINDIKLDLEIPKYKRFDNISIYTEELDKIEVDIEESYSGKLTSKIGLEYNKYEKIVITIPKSIKIKNPIVLDYLFDEDNKYLVDNVEINMGENSSASFIIHYCDENNVNHYFHQLQQTTKLQKNSNADIVIANLINNTSDSFISIENDLEENSKLNHILIEMGGMHKISNYYTSLTGDSSENDLKSIYLGTENDIIDINYNIETIGKNTKCNIESQGAIDDNSKKSFKGTIDFKEGSKKAVGIENENCMILSNKAKSKSMPVLLCHEEDVNGEHGVSSGKLDEDKLFYIMTKGISYDDARKLIVKANFNNIINKITNKELKKEIISEIDKKI